jgi:formylmethanofuran dehydrogenase subunit B
MSTVAQSAGISPRRQICDFVCTACGCACDDLSVTVEGERIIAFEPPCPLAEAFLLADYHSVESGDATALIAQAAELLRDARAPLVMGFERATVEAQRLAVAMADRLGAFIDPTDERGASRSHAAVQTVGAVTATLGEVAQRCDFIVYWECDPATTHPRHMDRFASRDGQRTVIVANWPTPSAALADEYLLIPAGSGVESLWTLRALVRGIALDAENVELQTGNSLAAWQHLADQLKAAHYAAIFFDASFQSGASRVVPDPGACERAPQAITELVRDLHRHTRAAALSLGAASNAVGAAQVLAWQTGFPAAVSFARGYPQHLPEEATAVRLITRREVDVALIIAADPLAHWPPDSAEHLKSIPLVVLDDRDTLTAQAATVAIRTASFGIAEMGDVYRSDGVALPLRPAIASPHQAMADVLGQLAALIGAQTLDSRC